MSLSRDYEENPYKESDSSNTIVSQMLPNQLFAQFYKLTYFLEKISIIVITPEMKPKWINTVKIQ